MVNKDPLSLSINDQTCDVSHSCVTGCANILSAKGKQRNEKRNAGLVYYCAIIGGLIHEL